MSVSIRWCVFPGRLLLHAQHKAEHNTLKGSVKGDWQLDTGMQYLLINDQQHLVQGVAGQHILEGLDLWLQ